jgi:predicted S18 family serine protease
MPIRIEWENEEHTTVLHIYEGVWTVAEYYHLIDENRRMIDEAGHTVDIINDLRETTYMPPDMVPAIRYSIQKRHPNEGVNVLVGANALVYMLVEAVNKVARLPITEVNYVNTIEEARLRIAAEKAKRNNP